MSKPRLVLLAVIVSSLLCIDGSVEASLVGRPETIAFIKASCRSTRYPSLCISCMSGFAHYKIETSQQLAHVALSVSLNRARNTMSFLLRVAEELKANNARDYRVVKDCLQQIDDSATQLTAAIKELTRLDGKADVIDDEFLWHIGNVETWVSAALTDASFCANEFHGYRMNKMRAMIKGKVMNVAEVTSNALALFHRYAAKYRASAANKP